MKFSLSTSNYFYPNKEDRDKLGELGFSFRESKYGFAIEGEPEVEIGSLEELIKFSQEFGELVFCGSSIEIYNGYRE